jgi:hypothetical protein
MMLILNVNIKLLNYGLVLNVDFVTVGFAIKDIRLELKVI